MYGLIWVSDIWLHMRHSMDCALLQDFDHQDIKYLLFQLFAVWWSLLHCIWLSVANTVFRLDMSLYPRHYLDVLEHVSCCLPKALPPGIQTMTVLKSFFL